MTPILGFEKVSKVYDSTVASGSRSALSDVSFQVGEGRKVAIVGRSGSGKSTLLGLAAGIDIPTSGQVQFRGRDLGDMPEETRTRLRRDEIGLVFQFFHLLPHLTVSDNVALPSMIAGEKPRVFRPRVEDLLSRVGLADRAGDTVEKLSGGEMQRVAICRALLRRPRLLLADEPTGNLDDENAQVVMDLMLDLVSEEGATLLYVTHSGEAAGLADEVWEINSGGLTTPPHPPRDTESRSQETE